MVLYKQLKVSVEHGLAESFKRACVDAGVSMAAELSGFMAARAGIMAGSPAKASGASYNTRGKRRAHVSRIVSQLEAIKDCEAAYFHRIPDNLQSSQAYENAELAIESLEQAIDLLNDAY